MPSLKIARGAIKKNDIIVIIEKSVMLSKDSSFLTINFLLKTLRDWLAKLEAIALENPDQLKVASVSDANPTPPTIGTREEITQRVGISPRNKAERTTEKKGSIALIVCVNETATFPKLILVNRLPNTCTTASGRIAAS